MNTALMTALTNAHGPSGREDEVRSVIYHELKNYVDDIQFDGLGSVIARLNNQATGPKVAVIAHMDEVGFLIQHITSDGYLKLFKLGGIDPYIALNSRIEIKTRSGNKYQGITFTDKPLTNLSMDDLFVDIGAVNLQDVLAMGIEIGDSAVFATRTHELNNSGNFVSKSFDDRIGCLLGMELLQNLAQQPLDCDLYFIGSAQEEVGTKGGKTATDKLRPDVVIVLDVASTKHTPSSQSGRRVYGKGPCLVVADKCALAHYPLFNYVSDVARENNIDVQRDFLAGGGTDNGSATLVGEGIAGMAIILPVKNCHSPYTLVNKADYEACLSLLENTVKGLNAERLASFYRYL